MCKLYFYNCESIGQTLCKPGMIFVVLPQKFWGMQSFKASEITSKMRPSLCINKSHSIGYMIFEDVQTMCKPNIALCKPKSAVCKLFCTMCKPTILSNSNVFCKTLWRTFLFSCAYYVPHIPGSTRWSHFLGSEKVYSLYHISCGFAPRCALPSRICVNPALAWQKSCTRAEDRLASGTWPRDQSLN